MKCKVLTVEATNDGKGIDKALAGYADVFAKAPFNGFDSFKLVQEKKYTLELGAPSPLKLRDLKGTLEYTGRTDKRLKLTLKLDRPAGSPVVIEGKASSGAPFIAAGMKSPSGRWVIAVECTD